MMKSIDVLNLFNPHHETLSSLLDSRTQRSDQLCLVFRANESTTRGWKWREFVAWTAGLSDWLSQQNLSDGAKVAIVSRNSDLYVALTFALADQGLVMVPVNPDLTETECQYILKHSDSELVLYESEFSQLVTSSVANNILRVVELGDSFLQKKAEALQFKAKPEDIFLMLYTSGTTGFPKGVMHSQKSAVLAGEAFVERMRLEPSDKLLCILPFFHINALFYSLMGSIAAGATLLVVKKFSASKFWQIAQELGATQVNIIAAVGNILTQRDRSEFTQHPIKKVYGAPVSAQVEQIFKSEFQIPTTLEGYGMTEIPGAINNQIEGQWKVGTMGVAARHPDFRLKFTELKIVDDSEQEVAAGEVGELVVKTPLLMKGYYKDEKLTKESFTSDGWFKSGDLVRKDPDGFYVFVTRKKDIIRRRGENISGAEIDRVVSTHPQVSEAAAIGVPSPLGEEEIFLAVVLRSGPKLSESDLQKWCGENLNKIKCPKFIKFFPTLPHTPTARVAKFKLKADPQLMIGAVEF